MGGRILSTCPGPRDELSASRCGRGRAQGLAIWRRERDVSSRFGLAKPTEAHRIIRGIHYVSAGLLVVISAPTNNNARVQAEESPGKGRSRGSESWAKAPGDRSVSSLSHSLPGRPRELRLPADRIGLGSYSSWSGGIQEYGAWAPTGL